jgi:VIT1/CCC1 family predicted Fe2+/Mn2+ transporter
MNILRRLFSKAIESDKIIDFSLGALDRINFTNQERAEHNQKLADAVARFAQETLSESTDRSVTRRYLSVIIVTMYLVLVLGVIALAFFNPGKAKMIMEIMKEFYLTTGFIMILAFFFGGYYLNGAIQQKK